MPTFDYKCPDCDNKKEVFVHNRDDVVKCGQCRVPMKKLFNTSNIFVFPRFGIHLHHVCNGGKTFHSTKEMKKYAKNKNLELGALL